MTKCNRVEIAVELIPKAPESGHCTMQNFQPEWVIGLTEVQAKKIIEDHGKFMCISSKELMKYDITKVYNSNRVKVKIVNKKIIEAEIG